MQAGAYAVVRAPGEAFLRASLASPALLGEAAGHAGLAAEHPVVFAGEVEVDGNGALVAWGT
eukprot:2187321-Lingulodinium_polyedra.AAC.1